MRVKRILLGLLLFLVACTAVPKRPSSINNACTIANTHSKWKQAFVKTYRRYGVPPHVVMAIIYHESHFRHDARPPRKRVFWFFKGRRPSTAFGYAQALDGTWADYKKATGRHGADRDYLPDAVDFVGWYVNNSSRRTGVSKWNAAEQYLAYHEGVGGYLRKRHQQKPWLLRVASRVDQTANRFKQQLTHCD